jgi:nucleotide-binding universal stress UspA family protein
MKILLAVVPDAQGGLATLETALVASRDLGCHLRVLHVRPDPSNALPLVGEAMSGAMIDDMMKVCEAEGLKQANAARTLFDQVVARYDIPLVEEPPGPSGLSVSYIEDLGQEDEQVAFRGRMADLIVLGRPTDTADEAALQASLNAAVMESGRPVLVAPPQPIHGLDQTAVIAWNGSAEAARAVSAALPFLLRASKVMIAVAEQPEGSQTSASELENHLAWHGVEAQTHVLTPSGSGDVGPAILRLCAGENASLLVMGAYTHSRLRQLIMGGVTRHVIDHAPLPVLLSH